MTTKMRWIHCGGGGWDVDSDWAKLNVAVGAAAEIAEAEASCENRKRHWKRYCFEIDCRDLEEA